MKMPDCIEAYRITFLAGLVLIISGCDSVDIGSGSGGGCASTFNPSNSFTEQFETFTIQKNADNPANAKLEQTLFRQFFRAAYPQKDGKDSAEKKLYDFMASETQSFTGFEDLNESDPPDEYDSVRNGFDLLEAMIINAGSDEPLQVARDAMASCARDTQMAFEEGGETKAGSIAVRDITVTEKPENEGDDPVEWPLGVNYAHSPEPLKDPTPFGPNVRRILFTPESFIFTLYDFEKFTGIGAASDFKQPGKLIAGFNASLNETIGDETNEDSDNTPPDGEEECEPKAPSVIFESFPIANTQDDRLIERGETDRWSWSAGLNRQCEREPETILTPDGSSVDAQCIRTTIDYANQNEVTVELSSKTCPSISDPSKFSADKTFTYTPKTPDVPQTR